MPDQRFALITGCGKGGIGEALANEYLRKGLEVIATVLPTQDEEHLAGRPRCHVCKLDVTQEDSIQKLKQAVEEITGGRLNVLANNAGVFYRFPAVDQDRDDIERLIHINLLGPMRMVSVFHRLVVRAKGVITFTCSVNGIAPAAWCAAYNASKAALTQYGDSLRIEMRPLGVRVVNVITGETDTNITKADQDRHISPESLYAPMQSYFRSAIRNTNPNAIPPSVHARVVVQEALKPDPRPWLWVGPLTSLVWFLSFFPRSVFDLIITNLFKLNKLRGPSNNKRTWSERVVALVIRDY